MIHIKRAYDDASEADGVRILVDRIWPRGVSKEKARVDIWLKEIAPSKELRKWFNHDSEKWDGFQKRYETELEPLLPALTKLIHFIEEERGTITLVYAAKDEKQNNAVALRRLLS